MEYILSFQSEFQEMAHLLFALTNENERSGQPQILSFSYHIPLPPGE
jgi:hypothetical protein